MYEVGYRVENQGFGNFISCGNGDVITICLSVSHARKHARTYTQAVPVCKSASS